MGAKTSGNVNFDVGGGFPSISNGVNSGWCGCARHHALRLEEHRSRRGAGSALLRAELADLVRLVDRACAVLLRQLVGVDAANARRASHRRCPKDSTFTVQGGILDPLTGEPPYYLTLTLGIARRRLASVSRQPAYAGRIAYSHPVFGHTFTVGDCRLLQSRKLRLRSRRQRLRRDGRLEPSSRPLVHSERIVLPRTGHRRLGGGIGRSVLYSGPLIDPTTSVVPLNTVGGWAQLKYRPTSKLEFNAAFGQDNPFAADVRYFADAQSYGDPTLARNQGCSPT